MRFLACEVGRLFLIQQHFGIIGPMIEKGWMPSLRQVFCPNICDSILLNQKPFCNFVCCRALGGPYGKRRAPATSFPPHSSRARVQSILRASLASIRIQRVKEKYATKELNVNAPKGFRFGAESTVTAPWSQAHLVRANSFIYLSRRTPRASKSDKFVLFLRKVGGMSEPFLRKVGGMSELFLRKVGGMSEKRQGVVQATGGNGVTDTRLFTWKGKMDAWPDDHHDILQISIVTHRGPHQFINLVLNQSC